jgi:UDP-4-amino-4-deoxy-L-arabinose formyltransferase/UDP-glucuronic acid dehydrogenase (UDP-4-keto-hexauronic acid decarboxylating)
MKVAFYGVTAWGNTAFARLIEAGFEVWRVFTRTEAGPCPHFPVENFATFARARGCAVVLDRSADDDPSLLAQLAAAKIDLLVSCGYHRKIGAASIAAVGQAINVHPSLLPKYRGSSPSNWVIVNGETHTGVTLHAMTSRLDSGDIFVQQRMSIGSTETAGELRLRQAAVMADVLEQFSNRLRSGTAPRPIPQNDAEAKSYRAITRADARVDPVLPVRTILDLVRGTTPWPGPWLELDGIARGIRRATPIAAPASLPGRVFARSEAAASIAARDGALRYELEPVAPR